MLVSKTGKGTLVLGFGLILGIMTNPAAAQARTRTGGHYAKHAVYTAGHHVAWRYAGRRYAPVLQCVAFAKEETGIDLAGNAVDWWDNAAGVYARGRRPEQGSVLSFQASGRMRLGHVAVVSRVIDSRLIEIDQAHWPAPGFRGSVTRGIPVVDVSEANDWSEVRVGLGLSGDFGRIYPTNGFIYLRPDRQTTAQTDTQNPHAAAPVEVAEAPARTQSR